MVAGFSKFIALALPCLESAPCGGVLQIFLSYNYRLHCIPARVSRTGQLASYHSNKLYIQGTTESVEIDINKSEYSKQEQIVMLIDIYIIIQSKVVLVLTDLDFLCMVRAAGS